MPPPEGHDSAMPLLRRSSPPPTIPLYSYNPRRHRPAPSPPFAAARVFLLVPPEQK